MVELKQTITILVEYSDGKEEGYPDEEPGYTASCPEIGLVTEGDTFEDLLSSLNEALDLSLDDPEWLAERGITAKPQVMLSMKMPGYHAQTA